jgi:hypothetical protein
MEEFDEREFLIRIQDVAYVSNHGRFLRRQRYLLVECVLQLDGRFGGLGVGHDRVLGGGDSTKDSSSSWSSTDAISLSTISQLSLSQS